MIGSLSLLQVKPITNIAGTRVRLQRVVGFGETAG
jgi:hypothetical protein